MTAAAAAAADPARYRRGVLLLAVRYGIPLALLVAGVVVAGTSGRIGLTAGAMFVSAATAVLLLNVLFRLGMEGDRERDREEAARRYFDEQGRWPDDPGGVSRSKSPPSI
jgi:hypothetical protein